MPGRKVERQVPDGGGLPQGNPTPPSSLLIFRQPHRPSITPLHPLENFIRALKPEFCTVTRPHSSDKLLLSLLYYYYYYHHLSGIGGCLDEISRYTRIEAYHGRLMIHWTSKSTSTLHRLTRSNASQDSSRSSRVSLAKSTVENTSRAGPRRTAVAI